MIGETIYIIMKVTQDAIPVAWRLTELEAEEAKRTLAETHATAYADNIGIGYAWFFVMPVTNA